MLNGNIFACKYVISFIVVSKVLTFSPFQLDQKKKKKECFGVYQEGENRWILLRVRETFGPKL